MIRRDKSVKNRRGPPIQINPVSVNFDAKFILSYCGEWFYCLHNFSCLQYSEHCFKSFFCIIPMHILFVDTGVPLSKRNFVTRSIAYRL